LFVFQVFIYTILFKKSNKINEHLKIQYLLIQSFKEDFQIFLLILIKNIFYPKKLNLIKTKVYIYQLLLKEIKKEKMKKILQEFKQFAMRGNVIDMAVGIIIGGAFGKIVSSIVSDIIMPPIGLLIGGVNFTDLKITLKHAVMQGNEVITPAVTINYGNFLQTTLDFVIVAFAIFLMVKGINALHKKKEEKPAEAPAPPADVQLLTEIRDLLKKEEK